MVNAKFRPSRTSVEISNSIRGIIASFVSIRVVHFVIVVLGSPSSLFFHSFSLILNSGKWSIEPTQYVTLRHFNIDTLWYFKLLFCLIVLIVTTLPLVYYILMMYIQQSSYDRLNLSHYAFYSFVCVTGVLENLSNCVVNSSSGFPGWLLNLSSECALFTCKFVLWSPMMTLKFVTGRL